MRAASGYKPAGFAIWRLGSEDPSIWSILEQIKLQPGCIAEDRNGYLVDFEGNGNFLMQYHVRRGAKKY
jgi:hypothetical protein